METKRIRVPLSVQQAVLVESGFRCAVPTCRTILAIDLHHIEKVSDNGRNEPGNLVALCPTCHALYHRGIITQDAILVWKGMLVALNNAFDRESTDILLLLRMATTGQPNGDFPVFVSGDGLLKLARLVAAGLVGFELSRGSLGLHYAVKLTEKGQRITDAWEKGDRKEFSLALGSPDELSATS